jgi:hypothetical protein
MLEPVGANSVRGARPEATDRNVRGREISEASRWGFSDMVALIVRLMPDRSDPSMALP